MCPAISQHQFNSEQLRLCGSRSERSERSERSDRALFFGGTIGAMWVLRSFLALLPMAWALPVPPCADIHTWHNVTAFRGTWKAQLSSINEKALFYHPNCTEMGAAPTFEVTWGGCPWPVDAGSRKSGLKRLEAKQWNCCFSTFLGSTLADSGPNVFHTFSP